MDAAVPSACAQKYFAFAVGQITSTRRPVPRGALAHVINAGRDAVDADGTLDERC
jgi:hypothetical protein